MAFAQDEASAAEEQIKVVDLGQPEERKRYSRGFWRDAWRRLRRNKIAIIGIVIILVNVFMAIFADWIAPYSYEDTELESVNTAPQWIIDLFPVMKAIDSTTYTFEGQAGDVITLEMDSSEFATTLRLRGPDGEQLRYVKGNSLARAARISDYELPVDGTYTLVAAPLESGSGGEYTLNISQEAEEGAEEAEPSPAEGERLRYNQVASGNIEKTGYVVVSNDYLLGSDNLGRDLLSRIIYGSRISLLVALVGSMVSLSVGLIFGLVSGFFGGAVDNLMMRIVDIMYAFPTILLIILMMAYFRAGFTTSEEGSIAYTLNKIDAQFGGMLFIFIGIGLTSWMAVARLTRGQVLSVREMEYIDAAVSIGTPRLSIIGRHILPNILGPIVVSETLSIPAYISFEAFLSFIGLGVQKPTPSWGSMIADGAQAISAYPYQAIFPALALFFIMFAFNFLGDGLRDALDPRSQ